MDAFADVLGHVGAARPHLSGVEHLALLLRVLAGRLVLLDAVVRELPAAQLARDQLELDALLVVSRLQVDLVARAGHGDRVFLFRRGGSSLGRRLPALLGGLARGGVRGRSGVVPGGRLLAASVSAAVAAPLGAGLAGVGVAVAVVAVGVGLVALPLLPGGACCLPLFLLLSPGLRLLFAPLASFLLLLSSSSLPIRSLLLPQHLRLLTLLRNKQQGM